VLERQAVKPARAALRREVRRGPLGQRRERRGVAVPARAGLVPRNELLGRELLDRREHREPRLATVLDPPDQAVLDELL